MTRVEDAIRAREKTFPEWEPEPEPEPEPPKTRKPKAEPLPPPYPNDYFSDAPIEGEGS